MATNEPSKPDNIIDIDPGKQKTIEEQAAPGQPLEAGGEVPIPEMTTGETVAPAHEGETVLENVGAELIAPAAPVDIGGADIPGPGDVGETEKPASPAPESDKPSRRGRPPKADKGDNPGADAPKKEPKAEKAPKADKPGKQKQAAGVGGVGSSVKEEAPPVTSADALRQAGIMVEQPPAPLDATRNGETEQIVYLNLSELHAFKNHPFGVRNDAEMVALVESVKNGGVNQPALVRPREDGGYEIIAGHRRQKASELAGYANMPCIVRNMTDDEAILAMTDDNLRQRSEILPSEKAVSLKMQVEAINHRGSRGQNVHNSENGKKSIEVVGERNNITGKQVQRYIRLTSLVPDLIKAVDEKKLGFTPAVEISFIKPKNQNFIAVALESQQSAPSLSQAQRLRELDQKGQLNGDVIDGILCEQKKEEIKVIISGKELETYFGKDKTPQQMKGQIIKLLDDWAGKEKAIAPPEKKPALEK